MTGGSKQLEGYLRELHLPTVREHLEEVARKAQQEELSYEQFLLELVELESQVRRENRIHRRMRQSKLPPGKDLASFELKRIPAKVRRQVKTLLDGSFLDRKEDDGLALSCCGDPGRGCGFRAWRGTLIFCPMWPSLFRLQFIRPGEDQGNRKSDKDDDTNRNLDSIPNVGRKGSLSQADDPGPYHHVHRCHAVDLPSLQFSQEQRELGRHVDGSGKS